MSGYDPYGMEFDHSSGNDTSTALRHNASLNRDDSLNSSVMDGQSLDDIVGQNEKIMRRQSMPQSGYRQQGMGMGGMSNMGAMMEFNSGPAGQLNDFAFDPATSLPHDNAGNIMPRALPRKSSSHHQLSALGSPYPPTLNTNYAAMMADPSTYQSPDHGNMNIDMDMNNPFLNQPMNMNMNMDFQDNSMAGMNNQQMNAFAGTSPYQMTSPMHTGNLSGSIHGPSTQDPGGGGGDGGGGGGDAGIGPGSGNRSAHQSSEGRQSAHSIHQRRNSADSFRKNSRSGDMQSNASRLQHPRLSGSAATSRNTMPPSATINPPNATGSGFEAQPQRPVKGSAQDKGMHNRAPALERFDSSKQVTNHQGPPWPVPDGGWPSTMTGKPHMQSIYKNAYSSTGFDMLGVLMRVATRPNPEINLGSVDLSCAFVVCDAEKDDFPIIYCSENFERLTGYTRHMILGRNCRFLQSPDGNVEPGRKRKYVDDDSILYLKNMINSRSEAQISLINYRRGGQPFMNLLTMIPITWTSDQVKFFVGFQVDLVEQPNAVTDRNPDGSYTVNYARSMTMPRYVMQPPSSSSKGDFGQTVPRDDVSAILSTIGSGESEYAKRMWDKVLLENTDDVIHVLSLKGLFQWVSPSSLRVLEYEPGELIGTALSSVCHPSDIVPVTRELKDTSSGSPVNVVYRIRRKHSGYMWFEGHGSLHTEQGKGRKSIIMVGRERPVYALSKSAIAENGGIGEHEIWTKMSTSGMLLYVSGNVRQLLDRQPEELVGVSLQSLMRSASKQDFGRVLELARTGKRASVRHEVINRRGHVLQAFTTLYPGDATEGLKPTFILAQTRLIKYTRNTVVKPVGLVKNEKDTSESDHASQQLTAQGSATPLSRNSAQQYVSTGVSAATYAGQNGLPIGRQDASLASDDNLFDELRTTKSSSWQYEIRQLEKRNRMLAEEVQTLLTAKKKRKRRKGAGLQQKDCANCHTRVTPEWRRGPSGQRDLCNSCGLRWAKLNGRVSPRTNSQHSRHSGDAASDKASRASASPRHSIDATANSRAADEQRHHHHPAQPQAAVGSAGAGASPQRTSGLIGGGVLTSPAHRTGESHASHMEGASGVPSKIDEGVEP